MEKIESAATLGARWLMAVAGQHMVSHQFVSILFSLLGARAHTFILFLVVYEFVSTHGLKCLWVTDSPSYCATIPRERSEDRLARSLGKKDEAKM